MGSQGKAYYEPGNFAKAIIISGYDTELIDRISLLANTHPVWWLLLDGEAIKREPSNILPVENHIRAYNRQGQERHYLRGRAYRAWYISHKKGKNSVEKC